MTQENRAAFIAAQSNAQRAAAAFGSEAPPPTRGESLQGYVARLVSAYKQHSAQWKDVELYAVGLDALDVIAPKVYADAMHAAKYPTDIPAGQLREVIETDRGGRPISRFYASDPGACWDQFKMPTRFVVGWNVPK